MTKAESVTEAENIMNAELSKISTWARENKLQFNEQKSQVMLLTRRKRKENKEIKIYINNRPLTRVNNMEYLGIIFDHKLTFKEHINYMAEKCTKLIFSLSKSAKLNWGLQHAALKQFIQEHYYHFSYTGRQYGTKQQTWLATNSS
jgi:hypothetical protein